MTVNRRSARLRPGAVGLLLVLAVLATPARAVAYRPFITEDAGVAGEGVAQLEVGVERSHWRGGDRENVLLAVPIYGLTPRLELSVEVPLLILEPQAGRVVAGGGDVGLVAKFRLLEEQPRVPMLTLRGNVKTPSGSERRGLGSGTWDAGLAAVATKTFAPVTLHAMLGYSVVLDGGDERQNIHVFGVAADWRVAGGLHLVGEVAGNGHPQRRAGPDPITGLLGAIYEVSDRCAIDVGLRRGFNDSVPAWTVTTGVTLTF